MYARVNADAGFALASSSYSSVIVPIVHVYNGWRRRDEDKVEKQEVYLVSKFETLYSFLDTLLVLTVKLLFSKVYVMSGRRGRHSETHVISEPTMTGNFAIAFMRVDGMRLRGHIHSSNSLSHGTALVL